MLNLKKKIRKAYWLRNVNFKKKNKTGKLRLLKGGTEKNGVENTFRGIQNGKGYRIGQTIKGKFILTIVLESTVDRTKSKEDED